MVISKLTTTAVARRRLQALNGCNFVSKLITQRCYTGSCRSSRHGVLTHTKFNHWRWMTTTATEATANKGGSSSEDDESKTVDVTFVERDGSESTVKAKLGETLLNITQDNNVDLECACGGELACSTCHLIFEEDVYNELPEMQDEEEDMLDLAHNITDTSRLGCQIEVTENFSGTKITLPDDGF